MEDDKFSGCPLEQFSQYAKLMNKLSTSKEWPLKNRCGRVDCKMWRWDECQCKPGVNTECKGCE